MVALRWLLILPAALLCAVLATFPLHWILVSTFGGNGTIQLPVGDRNAIEQTLIGFVTPLAMIFGGAATAPSHRVTVAGLLAAIVAVLVVAIRLALHRFEPLGLVMNVLGIAAGVASTIGYERSEAHKATG